MTICKQASRALAGSLLVACVACGDKRDCPAKVKPVIEAMFRDNKKPMPPDMDKDIAELCSADSQEKGAAEFHACIASASSDGDTAGCLKPLFEDYQKGMSDSADKARARMKADRDAREAADRRDTAVLALEHAASAIQRIPTPPQGAKGNPTIAGTPVDPEKLPVLPVLPVNDHERGDELQLFAADADADQLVVALWPPSQPMLAVHAGALVTGRMIAPSRTSAAKSIASLAGIETTAIKSHVRSPQVTLSFAGAPQRDLFRLLADVEHISIVVAPATLPDVDIAGQRMTSKDVLAALTALDHLDTIKSGNLVYLVGHGTKLPELGAGAVPVDLDLVNGTVADAVAALRELAPVQTSSCDPKRFDLHVRKASLAEAIRALVVASGVKLDASATTCPVAAAASVDANSTLVAIARSGTKAAAVIETAGAPGLVTTSTGIQIGSGYIEAGHQTVTFPKPTGSAFVDLDADYSKWIVRVTRVEAVYREGSQWSARLTMTGGGRTLRGDGKDLDLPEQLRREPPQIGPTGVELASFYGDAKTHVPLATK